MSKSTPRPRSVHSDEYKLFVRLLREERERLGLTQRALSEKLEQHHTYSNLVERAERQLNVIELRQYCRALRIPFDDFVIKLNKALNEMESDQEPNISDKESTPSADTDQS